MLKEATSDAELAVCGIAESLVIGQRGPSNQSVCHDSLEFY